jgi:hypothetical protein
MPGNSLTITPSLTIPAHLTGEVQSKLAYLYERVAFGCCELKLAI